MKRVKTFFFGLFIESLIRFLKEELAKILKQALLDVDLACTQNLPNPNHILLETTHKVKGLKDHVHEVTDPEIAKLDAEIRHNDPRGLQQATDEQIEAIERKSGSLAIDIKRTPETFSSKEYKYNRIGITVLASIDSLLYYAAYQYILPNAIGAILFAAIVSVALIKAIHGIADRIRYSKSILIKYVWFIAGVMGAGGAFWSLGVLRQLYNASIHVTTFSPVWTMLISVFFFTTGLLIALKTPSKQERLMRDQVVDKRREIAKLGSQKNQLLSALKAQEKKYETLIEKRELFLKYQQRLIDGLDTQLLVIHAAVKKEFELKKGGPRNPNAPLLTSNTSI